MSDPREAVRGIQRHLEAIYALEVGADVGQFLVGSDGLGQLVEAGAASPELIGSPEQVLLTQQEDGVELAVYLADDVQSGLVEGRLQDHCHATEAVSHFLMLVWSGQRERRVRLLDLELQAEVDKASTVLLLDRSFNGGAGGQRLLERLFGAVQLLPGLAPHEQERYRAAHRLGRQYAQRLAGLLEHGVDQLLAELRRFYRLPAEGKRERAAQAA